MRWRVSYEWSSCAERRRSATGVAPVLRVEESPRVIEIRVEPHRDLKLVKAFGLAADLEEQPPDVRVRVSVGRVHRQHAVVRGERLVVASEPRGGEALIELGAQVIGVDRERLGEPDQRLRV